MKILLYISILTLMLSCTENSEVVKEKTPNISSDEVFKKGEILFSSCQPCHYKNNTKLVGPGLKGITKRQTREQIKKWIINSQALIQSGDKYAVDLYLKYNKATMLSFALSDEEIDALIFYIEN